MNRKLPNELLSNISGLLTTRMGLLFPPERWNDLERGMESAAREFGAADAESCGRWLLSSDLSKEQIEILASNLTVGETYFFRDRSAFAVLEQQILPDLILSRRNGDRRLRIWSAACCTGEEPYSIAILLHKLIPDIEDWNVTILATDINPRFLRKAAEGVYGKWAFRDTPEWVRNRYFQSAEQGRFELKSKIKKLVQFSYLNLAEDSYPSLLTNTNGMDLIFCRNVLMYFSPEAAKKTVRQLYRSLVDGGWLITSSTDGSYALFSDFVHVESSGAILYRKQARRDSGPSTFILPIDRIPQATPSHEPEVVADAVQAAEFEITQEAGTVSVASEESHDASSGGGSYQEALALYQRGCYVEAEKTLVDVLEHNQENAEAMTLLARVYANQGRLGEALEWSQRAISRNKLRPDYYYLRSNILQELGAIEEARTSLRRAIFLDSRFVLAHYAMGNLALRLGQIQESKRQFQNVLSLLRSYGPEEFVPNAEGMTAGRLMQIVQSAAGKED